MELISRLSRAESLRIKRDVAVRMLSERLDEICSNSDFITMEDFRRIIVSRNAYFPDRLFQLFDSKGIGHLTKNQMIDCVNQIIEKPVTEKLMFFFQINDIDGDGLISYGELRHLLRSCMEENGLIFTEEEIDDLTSVLLEYADTDNTGAICFEEFQGLINRHPGLTENISTSIDRWLLPFQPETKPLHNYLSRKFKYSYIRNNLVSVSFFVVYCLINLILFGWRVTVYAEEGRPECIWIARGAGFCLNFNSSLILLLILRRTITFLRTLGLADYFPIDQHIYYHKLCGYAIVFFSLIHTLSHLINFVHIASIRDVKLSQLLFGLNSNFHWFYGAASITGWICLVPLLIILVSSLPCVRKTGHFEIFYYCHLFYFIYWIGLILHGPKFWAWFLVPCTLFIIERYINLTRTFGSPGHTYIEKGAILPSQVAHLVIKRPPNFDFRPGDWVFVQIPSIAKWEWHPFTISSAPEMEDVLWLHIRGVGEWTKRVFSIFEEQERQGIPLRPTFRRIHKQDKPIFIIENIGAAQNRSINDPEAFLLSKHTFGQITSSPYEKSRGDSSSFTMPLISSEGPLAYSAIKPTPGSAGNFLRANNFYSLDRSPLESPTSMMNGSGLHTTNQANASFQTIPLTRSICQSFKETSHRPLVRVNTRDLVVRLSNTYEARGITRHMSKVITFLQPEGKEWDEGNSRHSNINNNSRATNIEEGLAYYAPGRKRVLTSDIELIKMSRQNTAETPISSKSELAGVGNILRANIALPVRLDGPYGSPSSHIFNTQHAVLISTGIGVTPFASILQSIMFRYLEARKSCPRCNYSWTEPLPPSVMKLRKVDFVWINREQKSVEWFVHLLSQLEITQAELMEKDRFLDMHIYITSAIDNADIRAIGLHFALDLMHNKAERDLITGLKTRTRPGRPKWDEFFTEIKRKNKGRVSLFYCGPPPLGKLLHSYSNKFGFNFYKEIF